MEGEEPWQVAGGRTRAGKAKGKPPPTASFYRPQPWQRLDCAPPARASPALERRAQSGGRNGRAGVAPGWLVSAAGFVSPLPGSQPPEAERPRE
eukprot:1327985-Alexandrium_andersonii.AAC.1